MKLLAIETSCDETAVAVLEGVQGEGTAAMFTILGNALISQIEIHREYGGVYPMIAKREHAKNLVPLMYKALVEAKLVSESQQDISPEMRTRITDLLEREQEMAVQLLEVCSTLQKPDIDAIAVTAGPGLEPALWVGVNFARALSMLWDIPVISVNHMEGHICAALATSGAEGRALAIPDIQLPLLSLLISGGHTELVVSRTWGEYELVGQTRDDAVGEAFDKVARMMGLPYPGGPEISKLAEMNRTDGAEHLYKLPRPMIHDPHCDFSFSGLKTSVLYQVKDKKLTDVQKQDMAREFEDAATEVLYAKTARALEETGAKTLALGGGVSANTHIQRTFREKLAKDFPDVHIAIPAPALSTDNAVMIGLAGFYHALTEDFTDIDTLRANGNRKLRS